MDSLFERVLTRLGFSKRPEPTLAGLRALYGTWCRRVPFDNVRKVIHARAADPRPFPGSTAEDFFTAWLQHGTGGTCWSGAGACHTLLRWLGFDAERGIGTMLVAPHLPPNHGTVRVRFADGDYLVDCSILHGEPLRLVPGVETVVEHPAWGVRCTWDETGHARVLWRPLHVTGGLDCRYERFGATAEEYANFYEQTRDWSPFNYEVTARANRSEEALGVSFGRAVTYHADGSVTDVPVTPDERRRILIERIGLSEEIVSQLPPDVQTPPPPGSKTARGGS